MGEDNTETPEVIPRQWSVIQTVREKFTCRDCEKISQPPAPIHPMPRGWAGPNFLATFIFEKFRHHLPLNRQAERFAKEGVEIGHATLADQAGACAKVLAPMHALIRADEPVEVWSAPGSGVLARGLALAWPVTRRHVVQIGRELVPKDVAGARMHVCPRAFGQLAIMGAPFPADLHLDAKAWEFCVTMHGAGRVLFWNVAPLPRR